MPRNTNLVSSRVAVRMNVLDAASAGVCRVDLRAAVARGVDVVIIGPGVIKTPIWDKAERADLSRYDETVYGPAARRIQKWAVTQGQNGRPAELVANAVLRALRDRRPPARIVVAPRYLRDYVLPRLIPARMLDWLIAWRLGFLPKKEGG